MIRYDYIEVTYDGISTSEKHSGNTMTVRFHTDSGTAYSGFSAVWTEMRINACRCV